MDELKQVYEWLQISKRTDDLHLTDPAPIPPWEICKHDTALLQAVCENDMLWYPIEFRHRARRELQKTVPELISEDRVTRRELSTFQLAFTQLRDHAVSDIRTFQGTIRQQLQQHARSAFAPRVKRKVLSRCGEQISLYTLDGVDSYCLYLYADTNQQEVYNNMRALKHLAPEWLPAEELITEDKLILSVSTEDMLQRRQNAMRALTRLFQETIPQLLSLVNRQRTSNVTERTVTGLPDELTQSSVITLGTFVDNLVKQARRKRQQLRDSLFPETGKGWMARDERRRLGKQKEPDE